MRDSSKKIMWLCFTSKTTLIQLRDHGCSKGKIFDVTSAASLGTVDENTPASDRANRVFRSNASGKGTPT